MLFYDLRAHKFLNDPLVSNCNNLSYKQNRYFAKNFEWLIEQLEEDEDDDYLIFDCPGQIELYTHLPVMRQLVI